MKAQRLRQFSASFLIVLSLFVSSITACACTHHRASSETENLSCHHRSEMAGMKMNDAETAPPTAAASNNGCRCVQSAPKVFAENNPLKIQKHQALISPIPLFEAEKFSLIISVERTDFEPPFYLSDSFHNLSPGRAPPRL